MIESRIELIDEILDEHRRETGRADLGYRNHVYRMVNFCFALKEPDREDREKIIIAGCFHDLGIWTAGTFDYLPPSVDLAMDYLKRSGRESWSGQIRQMIEQHHRVRPLNGEPLAEVFRKGDLVDFSLGLIKCGLPANVVGDIRSRFPNAGFHAGLARIAGRWACRHPLNPVPILKW